MVRLLPKRENDESAIADIELMSALHKLISNTVCVCARVCVCSSVPVCVSLERISELTRAASCGDVASGPPPGSPRLLIRSV